ncbi:MAG: FAD-binding protein, partial [Solirubrobacterales bacterium]|nr:FAD-binding protein [Solirubrobacterales bacterium]
RRVTAARTAGGRCVGVQLDDGRILIAGATVLATGGAAALWSRSTNPPMATGGGLLLALAAGARLADLEFVQFHPTALVASDGTDGLLVTEAVRGEGARLLDATGNRFVDELAPRDEVARAVRDQIAQTGTGSVALDMREVDPALFPNVVTTLRRAGIDPEHELIPVAPAAHYMMGGIATDLDARASTPGLYAVGECSCTGLHGANRLASNSLTECFVFGARAARAAVAESAADPQAELDAPAQQGKPPPLTSASREALWRHAGLERDAQGLSQLEADPYPLVPLIARSALARTESRGAHRRRDFPELDPSFDQSHTTVDAGGTPVMERWS